MKQEPTILFDGTCNLCNGSVRFLLKHDKQRRFHFAALQSDAGQQVLSAIETAGDAGDSLVLVEGDRSYAQSTAVLQIARNLHGAWRLLYAFILIPRPIRDALYRLVARNRRRWFGQRDACMVPPDEVKARFLE